MTSKERMLKALHREIPDRVPVTLHQWQNYHLKNYMGGLSEIEAFRSLGLDAAATYYPAYRKLPTGDWREEITESHSGSTTVWDYAVTTPEGTLTYQICGNQFTSWYSQHMIKNYEDIYLFQKYYPRMEIKRKELEEHYDRLGDSGIARCGVPNFQGGCYQAAQVLFGTENLIYECYDNPDWVKEFLDILLERRLEYIAEQLRGAKVDLVETGGGGSSDTVISPEMHREFCLPYDQKIHAAIHAVGLPVVYHTCGGMLHLLDSIAENGCDASETFSPAGVGGNVNQENRAEVKQALGAKVALIGGMDQINLLTAGTPQQIREEVKRLFRDFGGGGGYIMSACDHFFEAPVENLRAYAQAARECVYE